MFLCGESPLQFTSVTTQPLSPCEPGLAREESRCSNPAGTRLGFEFENPSVVIFQRHWQGHVQQGWHCQLQLNCSLWQEAPGETALIPGDTVMPRGHGNIQGTWRYPRDVAMPRGHGSLRSSSRRGWSRCHQQSHPRDSSSEPAQRSSSSYRKGAGSFIY